MNLLVTGKGGTAGSWLCRGEQLGAALGARVKPQALLPDFEACDLAIVVKRTPEALVEALRASGKPWVYDVVDAYPQPQASSWSREDAIEWARARIRELRPNAVIWPTQRMREDCANGLPGFVLPHHHRPAIHRNPIREKVARVGYEGSKQYLGAWLAALDAECTRRGWMFVTNPDRLSDLDIVVAFRGGQWSGYPQRHWKSNVKLANAHASGTPFVGQMECGYVESATGAEYWAENIGELHRSFDWLESQSTREQVSERFLQAAYPVEAAAADLRKFLGTIV